MKMYDFESQAVNCLEHADDETDTLESSYKAFYWLLRALVYALLKIAESVHK